MPAGLWLNTLFLYMISYPIPVYITGFSKNEGGDFSNGTYGFNTFCLRGLCTFGQFYREAMSLYPGTVSMIVELWSKLV